MPSDSNSDAATRLNELGQLGAGVGHHVINAFSAVVSNAELLRLVAHAPDSIDPQNVADIIVRTAMDASTVARRLIDFTRSATAIGGDVTELDRLIEEIVEEERSMEQGAVNWVCDAGPVPPVPGSSLQIRTMLGHLITNAREAMPPSGGTITLATSIDDRDWIVLEVRDTGQGMSPAVQERAVEPFFTTKAGHFGVGLSIANGIWRRHRGTMALRTQVGEGTRVRLCIDPRPYPGAAYTPR